MTVVATVAVVILVSFATLVSVSSVVTRAFSVGAMSGRMVLVLMFVMVMLHVVALRYIYPRGVYPVYLYPVGVSRFDDSTRGQGHHSGTERGEERATQDLRRIGRSESLCSDLRGTCLE